MLRAAVTNDVFAGLSRNSAIGRRVADLLRGFLRAMGDPTDIVQQANALRAAELTVAAESARAKLLAGEGDIDAVARLEGVAARAVRALHLKTPAARNAEPTLADILRADREEQRAEAAAMAAGEIPAVTLPTDAEDEPAGVSEPAAGMPEDDEDAA